MIFWEENSALTGILFRAAQLLSNLKSTQFQGEETFSGIYGRTAVVLIISRPDTGVGFRA